MWRASSQTVQRLDTYGMLIGLDPRSQYQEGEVRLQPGDTLIYYTDGITEADNSKGDRFEEERLAQVLKVACQNHLDANATLDYIFHEVSQFVGNTDHVSDDMTLIVLQVTAPPLVHR